MTSVLVPLANGFEEIEAVTIIDILRRAGANVVTACLDENMVQGSHGIQMLADTTLQEAGVESWDLVVLPGGGPGTEKLATDERILELLRNCKNDGTHIGAICAAPYVLDKAGVIEHIGITSHPAWKEKISTGKHHGNRLQVAGNIITSQSAGTAMEFAFKLVEILFGKEKAAAVNSGVLANI